VQVLRVGKGLLTVAVLDEDPDHPQPGLVVIGVELDHPAVAVQRFGAMQAKFVQGGVEEQGRDAVGLVIQPILESVLSFLEPIDLDQPRGDGP